MIFALPTIQIYKSGYTWTDGASSILDLVFNLPLLVMQFKVGFYWPNFQYPKIQAQFVFGYAFVAVQCVMRISQVILRVSKRNPIFMLRFIPNGSKSERLMANIFSIGRLSVYTYAHICVKVYFVYTEKI
jgi:hypothetical protein